MFSNFKLSMVNAKSKERDLGFFGGTKGEETKGGANSLGNSSAPRARRQHRRFYVRRLLAAKSKERDDRFLGGRKGAGFIKRVSVS